MSKLFRLSVVTRDATVLDTAVSAVNLPMDFGSLGVLANHAPMLCAVSKGILRCTLEDGSTVRVRVSDGVADVADNEMTVLCGSAELLES